MRNSCHHFADLALLILCSCLFVAPAYAGALPKLSISDVTVSEVSCTNQQAVFTVSVSAPFGKNATVQYGTADGTAIAGTDYNAVSGTLSFPRGSKAAQTITVPIIDVLIPGVNKTFVLNLSNPVSATLTKSQGTGTIQAPQVAKCQSCRLSCDDGDVCTADSCDAVRGCVHVNASAAATPYCQLVGSDPNGSACNGKGSWVDSDGDGFSDAAEIRGYIDVNANGVYDAGTDIPLPDADLHKPDVYLHYDYTYASDHNHNPPAQAIQYMVDAFAAHGVNLHIDPQHNAICENAGDAGCITVGTGAQVVTLGAPGSGQTDPACAGPSAVSMHELRAAIPYLNLIKPAYHYMVFAHYASTPTSGGPYACPIDPENPACGAIVSQPPVPGNLGTAEIGGNDAIVATQPFVDGGSAASISSMPLEWWAGLGMHELGHNLGLFHGGLDCFNNKPNYVSVMNYSFYVNGIPVGAAPGDVVPEPCVDDSACPPGAHCSSLTNACFRIDYSDRLFNTLDESGGAGGLDENIGLQGGIDDTDISWRRTGGIPKFTRAPTNGTAIDWNQDGAIETGVIAEVNGDGQNNVLSPQNDWASTIVNSVSNFANLKFAYQCEPDYTDDLIVPRDLRLNNRSPIFVAAVTNFMQWLGVWRSTAAARPPDLRAPRTTALAVGPSGGSSNPAQSAPDHDWLKERIPWHTK